MTTNLDIIPTIKKLIEDNEISTILDLGCGNHDESFYSANFRNEHDILLNCCDGLRVIGIDAYQGCIDYRNEFGPPGLYFCADIRDFKDLLCGAEFDAIMCHHAIEHLPKEDGRQLIADIEECATKLIIIGAPNGMVAQKGNDNPHEEHKSGWTFDEFHGYEKSYKDNNVFIVSKVK